MVERSGWCRGVDGVEEWMVERSGWCREVDNGEKWMVERKMKKIKLCLEKKDKEDRK